MYEEYNANYYHLHLNEDKVNKFLSYDYYKILHLLSGEFLYRQAYTNSIKLESLATKKQRYTESTRCLFRLYCYGGSFPVVLKLASAKGFVRTHLATGELQKMYEDCTFNDFDYIKVSDQEALKAYAVYLRLGVINGKETFERL